MRFDPANPTGNTAVGLGYHQLIWSTWVSKRFRYFDPYFGASYMLPIRTNGSIYQDLGRRADAGEPAAASPRWWSASSRSPGRTPAATSA